MNSSLFGLLLSGYFVTTLRTVSHTLLNPLTQCREATGMCVWHRHEGSKLRYNVSSCFKSYSLDIFVALSLTTRWTTTTHAHTHSLIHASTGMHTRKTKFNCCPSARRAEPVEVSLELAMVILHTRGRNHWNKQQKRAMVRDSIPQSVRTWTETCLKSKPLDL